MVDNSRARVLSEDFWRDGSSFAGCTDDDSIASRGVVISLPFSTGTALGTILTPPDRALQIGPHGTEGSPLACSADGDLDARGAALTAVFTRCNVPQFEDVVVLILLSLDVTNTSGPNG